MFIILAKQRGLKGIFKYTKKLIWVYRPILPYCDKRKQLFKMTFLANEHNVFVMYHFVLN